VYSRFAASGIFVAGEEFGSGHADKSRMETTVKMGLRAISKTVSDSSRCKAEARRTRMARPKDRKPFRDMGQKLPDMGKAFRDIWKPFPDMMDGWK
jgi:hypothetical protein